MPKVSILVPVYKAEKTLDACVESILAQTFQDFELLLIDDESPDIKHGEAALDELEQKLGNARRHTRMKADLDRLRLLVTEIRCSNSGSFTPDPRITNDTAEMLTILHRLDTQEDADGL